MQLADLKWPDIAALSRDTPIVIPIAALEQHGRHMPLFTDSLLLGEVIRRVSERLDGPRAVHAADVAGQLGAPSRFPRHDDRLARGSISTCSKTWSRTFCFTAFGGSCWSTATAATSSRPAGAVRGAAKVSRSATTCCSSRRHTGRSAQAARRPIASFVQDQMGHACEWETSMMLRIRPGAGRRLQRRSSRCCRRSNRFRPAHRAWITKDLSEPGHIGQPSQATAEKGETAVSVVLRTT